MDISFYVFQSEKHLKAYSDASYELNKLTADLGEKYKDKFDKAYESAIFDDEDMPQIYSEEEQKEYDALMLSVESNEGKELKFLYGDSFASMIPAYFRKYHKNLLVNWWDSHYTHLIISEDIIDDLINKTEEVLKFPEKAMEILPVLDIYEVYGKSDDDPEEYRYGAYQVIDGKIYADKNISADDNVYIREIGKYNIAFKQVKELLNANPNIILAYYESL